MPLNTGIGKQYSQADLYLQRGTVIDGFTRANNATYPGRADSGQSWYPYQGTWGISSNQLYSASDATNDLLFLDSFTNNPTIQCTISGTLNSATIYRLPCLIFCGLDNSNFLQLNLLNGAINLSKTDAGTNTVLSTTATTTADGTNYTLKVIKDGLSITVLKNGTSLISHTLASANFKYLQWTKVGCLLLKAGAPATAARWSSYTCVETAH
ncbi:MAG: hypothetical protein HXX08_11435 [Chloroflexi bacterium]|uniref:Uncharacterized protein n=1 Tax=Candidatus Chlorohelix allophototropha TaxID=3003348 RepID=A0A8T7M0W7_9CHLR|nr:hypothetical protein [Chloroflexota bacterium]WJW65850.1 hypothetical protein OZ401_001629 [Chloroflexota bacterium L227-S17]